MFRPEGFSKLSLVGTGTYAQVWLAEDTRQNNKRVAIKRMHPTIEGETDEQLEGRKRTCIIELNILKHLSGHENVISLVAPSKHEYLVLDCMTHDLRGLLNSEHHRFFSHAQVKGYAVQALKGLAWCHAKGVIHRDLKPENMLVSKENVVKIADFGLACFYNPDRHEPMTTNVCATWYRAPELFLGTHHYAYEIDVWSMGCIVGELVADTPLLNRHHEEEQVEAIWRLLGTPLENGWTDIVDLPNWEKHKPKEPKVRNLMDAFQSFNKTSRKLWFTAGLLDLLDKMLALNPKNRINARDALIHAYWTTEYPTPQSSILLPKYNESYFGNLTKRAK
jgi:cyclin-dependent kinase 12/13